MELKLHARQLRCKLSEAANRAGTPRYFCRGFAACISNSISEITEVTQRKVTLRSYMNMNGVTPDIGLLLCSDKQDLYNWREKLIDRMAACGVKTLGGEEVAVAVFLMKSDGDLYIVIHVIRM